MAKRVLVPLDRTEDAETLVPIIIDMARGSEAAVRLLNVVTPVGSAGRRRGAVEAERLDYLRAVEVGFGDLPVDSVVRFGEPGEEIVREAEAFGADLIAVTTTGRRGVRRLLGSLAARLLRRTSMPVLVLRPASRQGSPTEADERPGP